VAAGWPLTYHITVTNLGPATADAVVVTNRLPAGFNFVSVTSSQGASGHAAGTVWASLGDLNSGATASVTLVVTLSQPGVVTNTATASSPVVDPLKANNTAAVKSTALAPMTVSAGSGFITLTTLGLPGSVLEVTPSLTSPVVWTPVLTNPPTVLNVPIGSGNQFFRLRPAGP
jgi:uncharacterized repeat protein (TIGR01451 family)